MTWPPRLLSALILCVGFACPLTSDAQQPPQANEEDQSDSERVATVDDEVVEPEQEEDTPAAAQPSEEELLRPPLRGQGDRLLDELAQEESGDGTGDSGTRQYDLGSDQVTGQKRERSGSGTTFDIEIGQLDALPFNSSADVMMLAPGVLTTNHGGEGHAHETFLRGFYAGEGQDIEYMVDGVPINEVSNPHGHGYTDLFFLPAGWIESMRLSQGSFDPEQGDFAFAGSVNFTPGVSERGLHLKTGWGSFDTRRLELTWAPESARSGTFAGIELNSSDGFGTNRASQRASTMMRYEGDSGGTGFRWSTFLTAYQGSYAQPGVLRTDDVEARRIDFFDTYDSTQGGESSRVLGNFKFTYGPNDALFEQVTWLGVRSMRLRQNFTGFLVPTETEEEGTRFFGDLQEGRYLVTTAGTRGSYTLGRSWHKRYQELSTGYSARFDTGRTELLRLRDRLDVPYARDFDREFSITNISAWARAQSELTEWLVLQGGLRLDTFQFNVRDMNQPLEDTDGERLTEQTIAATGSALNPRATATVRLAEHLRWMTSYGRGTRSTDAAALSETENAPFARADQAETGLRWATSGEQAALLLQGSYVYARVEQDIIFDPGAGRNILIGPSQRHAVLFQGRYTQSQRFDVLANLGWTRATTEERDETSLDFGKTVLLPYVPQLVARLDATYRHPFSVKVRDKPVALRTTANLTYTPGRPLPLGEFGDPFWLLGGALDLELGPATLRVEGRNLLDRRYRQSEFNYPSRFDPDTPLPASGAPRSVRHFVAGEPRFVMMSLAVHLSELWKGSGEPEPTASSLPANSPDDFE